MISTLLNHGIRATSNFLSNKKKKLKFGKLGNKNPSWLGGISFLIYPSEFNSELKKRVKLRDNNTCKLCPITEEIHNKRFKRNLSIHHIDYNKNNNNSENLITLCASCHQKTNFNRNYWKKLLTLKNNRDNIIV